MEQMLATFHSLNGELNKIHKEACTDVSVQQSTIMHEIQMRNEPSMQETARGLGMDITTFSRQVQTLVNGGYVKRRPYPGDRRIQILSLTDKGTKKVKQIDEKILEQMNEALASMGEFEQEIIVRSLSELQRILGGNEE